MATTLSPMGEVVPDFGDDPNFPAIFRDLAGSLRPGMARNFANAAARNSAWNTLTSNGSYPDRGFTVCTVGGDVYARTGGAWVLHTASAAMEINTPTLSVPTGTWTPITSGTTTDLRNGSVVMSDDTVNRGIRLHATGQWLLRAKATFGVAGSVMSIGVERYSSGSWARFTNLPLNTSAGGLLTLTDEVSYGSVTLRPVVYQASGSTVTVTNVSLRVRYLGP